jgi:competence protein ComEC
MRRCSFCGDRGCVLFRVLAFVAACGAAGFFFGWNSTRPTRLTFLSVGQGDCACFQTEGTTILIDTGPKTPTFDAGKRIVSPGLERLGADYPDLILLSHPDEDHVGGTGALLKMYPRTKVAMSAEFRGYPAMEEHLASWGLTDKNILWLGPRAKLRVGGFSLSMNDPHLPAGVNDNEGSMFVHLVGPSGSAEFSGDADAPTEKLMEPLEDWGSQVMKVGHHGSGSSSDPSWIAAVHPVYAVISCGLNNQYGHPSISVVSRLQTAGVKVFRTDLQGDISFDFNNESGFVPTLQPIAMN